MIYFHYFFTIFKYFRLSVEQKHGQLSVNMPDKIHVTLNPSPFRVDIYDDGTILTTMNAQNLLLIEPMKTKPR